MNKVSPQVLRWYHVRVPRLRLPPLRWCMALFAIVMIWFGDTMYCARRQRAAVEALEKDGAVVTYYHEMNGAPPVPPLWLRGLLGDDFFFTVVRVNARNTSAASLKYLQDLPHLQLLALGPATTDAGLENLNALTMLTRLGLEHTQITDAGLFRLRHLTRLQSLSLQETKIQGDGLKNLCELKQLQSLLLDCTELTDAGLQHLKTATQLESLSFERTKVSDAGLEHLRGLTRLKDLLVRQTQVTDAGVASLQRSLPKCGILHGPFSSGGLE